MTTSERHALVAPCGIDCGICELYLAGGNAALKTYLVSKGIAAEALPCTGCRARQGHCPVLGEQCATFACAQEHGAVSCGECEQFPCDKLSPAADRADVLPHNTKLFNLCVIARRGLEAFVAESTAIKHRYYKGKMLVGKGPQVEG
jgi:hypothetical protein